VVQSIELYGICYTGAIERNSATVTTETRVVVLVSGRGSNLRALHQAIAEQAIPARLVAVISNDENAPALAWSREQGLQAEAMSHRAFANRESFDAALKARIDAHAPDLVLLAGFMRILTPGFVRAFEGRLINIHPSLLPAFPGLHTHEQALQQGVQVHGCTIHYVTAKLDHGPIIAQAAVPVLESDTPDSLAARVLRQEHRLYPQVLAWLCAGKVSLQADGRVRVAGEATRLLWSDKE
jgi:phosphoribosylglycinamide formyltransferase-1